MLEQASGGPCSARCQPVSRAEAGGCVGAGRLGFQLAEQQLFARVGGEYIFVCFVLNNNHLFLIFLKFRKSKIKVPEGWVSRPTSQFIIHHVPAVLLHGGRGEGAVRRPFSKDSNPIHKASTLMTSFPKGPTSQHHHTGEWVSTYAFWEDFSLPF